MSSLLLGIAFSAPNGSLMSAIQEGTIPLLIKATWINRKIVHIYSVTIASWFFYNEVYKLPDDTTLHNCSWPLNSLLYILQQCCKAQDHPKITCQDNCFQGVATKRKLLYYILRPMLSMFLHQLKIEMAIGLRNQIGSSHHSSSISTRLTQTSITTSNFLTGH